MLGIERDISNILKYFNYEGNTEYLRSRVRYSVSSYLDRIQSDDGVSQYIVVCDDRNNTPETIDNNELHVGIYVRPVKSIEFIVLNFTVTNQTVDVQELVMSDFGV